MVRQRSSGREPRAPASDVPRVALEAECELAVLRQCSQSPHPQGVGGELFVSENTLKTLLCGRRAPVAVGGRERLGGGPRTDLSPFVRNLRSPRCIDRRPRSTAPAASSGAVAVSRSRRCGDVWRLSLEPLMDQYLQPDG